MNHQYKVWCLHVFALFCTFSQHKIDVAPKFNISRLNVISFPDFCPENIQLISYCSSDMITFNNCPCLNASCKDSKGKYKCLDSFFKINFGCLRMTLFSCEGWRPHISLWPGIKCSICAYWTIGYLVHGKWSTIWPRVDRLAPRLWMFASLREALLIHLGFVTQGA